MDNTREAPQIVGAPLESYSAEDQAFYGFWYGHMENDQMTGALANTDHSTARYIWDKALAAADAAQQESSMAAEPRTRVAAKMPDGSTAFNVYEAFECGKRAADAAEAKPVQRGTFELVRSIIHKCPALKLPQSFVVKLGMTAQIIPLKGCDDGMAKFIVDACNAAGAKPAPVAWLLPNGSITESKELAETFDGVIALGPIAALPAPVDAQIDRDALIKMASALKLASYSTCENHLGGGRLALGFERLEDAQNAQQSLLALKGIAAAQPQDAQPIEVWRGNRKVTIHSGEVVLRIWGADIEKEMSDEPFSLSAVQAALDWLYASPQDVSLINEGDMQPAGALPEKIVVGVHAYSKEYAEGWNDCIDEFMITRDSPPINAQPVAGAMDAQKYSSVICFQCGDDFGPGYQDFSHCGDHRMKEHVASGAADERALFEVEASTHNYDTERANTPDNPHDYASLATQVGWAFWQSRAALSTGNQVNAARPSGVSESSALPDGWRERLNEMRDASYTYLIDALDGMDAAQSEKDAQDAARYRYLVENCNVAYAPEESWQLVIWEPSTGVDWKKLLDESIDGCISPSLPRNRKEITNHERNSKSTRINSSSARTGEDQCARQRALPTHNPRACKGLL